METNTEIVPVTEFKQIIEAAPQALEINNQKVDKAVAAGESLLAEIQQNGMSDELDARCNSYLIKLKNTYADLFDRRKPLTEMFDRIRSVFTELEKQIDSKGKDNVYSKVQAKRNEYATFKMQEQKRKEEEVAKKLAYDKEVINVKFRIEQSVRASFLERLEAEKKRLSNLFESLTLPSWNDGLQKFNSFPKQYSIDEHNSINPSISSTLVPKDVMNTMLANHKEDSLLNFSVEYQNALTLLLNDLTVKLPSKRNELVELAEAQRQAEENRRKAQQEADESKRKQLELQAQQAEEEQKRKEAEAADRKRREEEEAAAKAAAAIQKEQEEAEARKTMEITNTLFDSQIEVAAVATDANAVESYEIEVKNAAAWLLIVSFYFEKQGKKEDVETLGKKSLNQMKKFCESHFKKSEEKIDSPYIVYKPVYKVRTQK